MKNLETAMLVLTSEIGFILTVIFIIWFVFKLKRQQKDGVITHNLVQQFKEEAPARRDNLLKILKASFHMQDEDAQTKLKELVSKEKSLYSHILKAFSGQDRSVIANLNDDIQSLISAYKSLAVENSDQVMTPGNDENPNGTVSNEELENLRAEKTQALLERDNLKKDLNTALDSIQKLQAEYTQMYGDMAGKPAEE